MAQVLSATLSKNLTLKLIPEYRRDHDGQFDVTDLFKVFLEIQGLWESFVDIRRN